MIDNPDINVLKNRIVELEERLAAELQFEQQLKASELKYKNLIENIPDIVYSLDQNAMVSSIHIPIASRFGYNNEDLLGKNFTELIYPEDRGMVAKSFIEAIETHREWTKALQFRVVAKDGTIYWMEANTHMQFDDDGNYIREDGVLRNIDEQKKYEEVLLKHHINLEKMIRERTSELERKNQALKESEEKYRLHFSQVNDVIYSIDAEFKILNVSPSVEKLLGYHPDQLIGRPFHKLNILAPEYLEEAFSDVMKVFSGEHISSTVYEFITKDGTRKFGEISGAPLIKDNKVIAVVSIARDITERKAAEKLLKDSEEKYRQIFRYAPSGIWETNFTTGKILNANDIALDISGYTREEVTGIDPMGLLTEESKKLFIERLNKIRSGETVPDTAEYQIKKKDGSLIWVLCNVRFFSNDENHICGSVVATDITERKKLEEDLRIKELAIASSSHGMGILDLEGNILYANNAAVRMWGGTDPSELIGKSALDLPISREQAASILTEVLKTGSWEGEVQGTKKDGSHIFTYFLVNTVYNDIGEPICFVDYVIDITERKKLEKELRIKDLAIASSNHGIGLSDLEGNIIYINNAALRMWGANDASELVGKSALDLPLSREQSESILKTVQEKGSWEGELEGTRKDGAQIFTYFSVNAVYDDNGEPICGMGYVIDITERKKLEKELHIKDLAIASSNHGIAIGDLQGNINYTNKAGLKMLGIDDLSEVIGKSALDFALYPEDANKIMKEVLEKGRWDGEVILKRKDGSLKTSQLSANIVFDKNNKPVCLMDSFIDITDRKKMEEALRESEEKYRTILESIEDGYYEVDTGGKLVFFNNSLCKMSGYSSSELMGKNSRKFMDIENTKNAYKAFNSVFRTGEPYKGFDLEFIKKDGSKCHVETSISFKKDSGGRIIGFQGIVRDITERKKIEKELRIKDLAIASSNHGIGIFDLQGNAMYLNNAAMRMLAVNTLSEVIGRSALDFAQNLEEGKNVFKNTREKGSWEGEIILKRNDDSQMISQLSANVVLDENNKPICFMNSFIDITERKKLEKELRIKDLAIASSNHGIGIGDLQGNIIYINNAAMRMLAINSVSEAMGKSALDFAPSVEEGRKIFKKVLEKGKWEREVILKRKDGSLMNTQLSANIVLDENNEPICVMNSFIDITDRKKMEEELKSSKQTYESLYSMMRLMCDNVPDMIWAKDMDKKYIFANKAICEKLLFAKDTNEPIGKDYMFFVQREREAHPYNLHWHDFGESFLSTDSVVMESQRPHRFNEYGNVQGQFFILDIFKAPFFDDNGQMIGTVGCARDVTVEKELEENRRKAEAELISSQKKISAMIDASSDLIFLKDTQSRYLVANKVHESLFKKKIEDIIGKTDFELMPQINAKQCYESDLEALKTGFVSLEEKSHDRTYHVVKQRVTDTEGNIIGIAAVIRDITELKKAEKDRADLEKKLRQAQKMEAVGTMAGGIAHDFNNILTAIIGYTEIAIEDLGPNSELADSLKEVYSAGNRAKELVKQILTFARQTDQEVKPTRVDIIAKEALRLMRSSIPATIEIESNIKSKSLVMADPTQIHQIFLNLCTNAAQAMEEDGGKLTVRLLDEKIVPPFAWNFIDLKPGNYLKLEVEDTGIGMSPEIMESIFEPYFTTKKSGEGTGLGLSVVHGIVKSYDGEILVESTERVGSLFKIYLPIIQGTEFQDEFKIKALPTGNERILFIDDEEPIVAMGSKMLEPLGFRVTTRTSSLEALELFRHKPNAFDLVITDMTMPNMTGDKLAVKLLGIRPDIPIILCTGYSKKFSKEKAMEIGVKAFLMKPLIRDEMVNTVRSVLDGSKS